MAKDPYQYFRIEAREILEGLGRGVLQLEKGVTPELTANLLRYAHTLKGAARVVKQNAIADAAHAIEDALAPLRGPDAIIGPDRVDTVLKLLDTIATQVRALDVDVPAARAAAPAALPERPAAEEVALRTVRADVAEMDALLDGVVETGVHLRGLRRVGTMAERLKQLTDSLAQQLADAAVTTSTGLPLARSMVAEVRRLAVSVEQALSTGVDQAERQTEQVRDAAERLRLFPVRALHASLERTARDVAHAQEKTVTFSAKGGDVRVDADVLAVVQGALVQMVRNAVAHGIEPPEERLRAGKSAAGLVELEVLRRGSRVAFVCRDDGRGIDIAAVRRVAQQRGVISPGGPALDDDQLVGLLFKGGLTTARTVTEHAGRGIGLDVVREAAVRLGGEVAARTAVGKGTDIELVVPVSRSSLDALLVEAGGATAAIPLEAVRRTLRLGRADIAHSATGDAIAYEGHMVPFVPLAGPLGRRDAVATTNAWTAVVVEGDGALCAMGVDRLLGVGNVVVRALPRLAPAAPVIAGAAIDDEGTPRLVLDPASLVAAAHDARQRVAPPNARRTPHILIVDDSLTTRMLEQSILQSAGFEVDLASSAEEGLERARRTSYDLFLVDVEMPGMDGFTFVETTRADPALRVVPAILVTSRNAPEDLQRGKDAGASDYVVKGEFDQVRLLSTIRRLVQ
ncbi:MAG TPA: response regulator [Polyangia bacterium]